MVMLSPAVTAHNLTAWFLVHPAASGRDYAVLEAAIAHQQAVLHETGQVNQLLIENLGDVDLFIQAGDIVKGGKQDRTLGSDFIVPARSGRLPLPAFCVEHARWSPRRAEPVSHFSESKHAVASKKARLALLMERDQRAVWDSVGDEQRSLRDVLDDEVRADLSPSSLELTYEHDAVRMAVDDYFPALDQAVTHAGDAVVGVVWAINGRLSHADRYGHSALFAKLWRKLQRAAATEALGERPIAARNHHGLDGDLDRLPEEGTIRAFLGIETPEAWMPQQEEQLPPRTRLHTERRQRREDDPAILWNARVLRFAAHDMEAAGEAVHVAVVAG
jgi:hypothetical protein